MIIKTEGDLCNWIWMDEMLHSETAFFFKVLELFEFNGVGPNFLESSFCIL